MGWIIFLMLMGSKAQGEETPTTVNVCTDITSVSSAS